MANRLTGAQRYNNRMDKIWEKARELGAFDEVKKEKKKMKKPLKQLNKLVR